MSLITQEEVLRLCADLENKVKINMVCNIGQVICEKYPAVTGTPASIIYNDIELKKRTDVEDIKDTLLRSISQYRVTVRSLTTTFNTKAMNKPEERDELPENIADQSSSFTAVEHIYSTIQDTESQTCLSDDTYIDMTACTPTDDASTWDNDILCPSRYACAYQNV